MAKYLTPVGILVSQRGGVSQNLLGQRIQTSVVLRRITLGRENLGQGEQGKPLFLKKAPKTNAPTELMVLHRVGLFGFLEILHM